MNVSIAPLEQKDLREADRIFRLAFGTFLGLPDPMAFGGDTDFIKVLLSSGDELVGVAVCHVGKGSEAGSGTLYVKFGAVSPGPDAPANFDRLLAACEALAHQRGAPNVLAGINTARHAAYRQMIGRGFRTAMVGVAMQRPNEPGYNRPDCYAIDDWR